MKAKASLRNAGMFLLHTLLAVLGAAVVESSLDKFIHVHTGADIVLRALGFSVVLPAVIAFFIPDRLRSRAAKWVWVLPVLFFSLGLATFSSIHTSGVLGETAWARFSGRTCGITLQREPCQYFVIFTIPLVRSVSYAAGAWLKMITQHNAGPAGTPSSTFETPCA